MIRRSGFFKGAICKELTTTVKIPLVMSSGIFFFNLEETENQGSIVDKYIDILWNMENSFYFCFILLI